MLHFPDNFSPAFKAASEDELKDLLSRNLIHFHDFVSQVPENWLKEHRTIEEFVIDHAIEVLKSTSTTPEDKKVLFATMGKVNFTNLSEDSFGEIKCRKKTLEHFSRIFVWQTTMPEEQKEAMGIFVHYLNDFQLEIPPNTSWESIVEFLEMHNMFCVEILLDISKEKVESELRKRLTDDNCWYLFWIAERFNLETLWEKAAQQLYAQQDDDLYAEIFSFVETEKAKLIPGGRAFLRNAALNYGLTRYGDDPPFKKHFEENISYLVSLQADGLGKLSPEKRKWVLDHLPKNLVQLNLSGADFKFFPPLDFPELKILNLSGCPKLVSLKNVSFLREITELNVQNCASLSNISEFGKLRHLRTFYFSGCPKISPESLKPLSSHPGRQGMRVNYPPHLEAKMKEITESLWF